MNIFNSFFRAKKSSGLEEDFLQKQKARGSFLADVIVSIGVMTITISASATIVNQSLNYNTINKNKIIALNLAREGVEAIQLTRNVNWLRNGTKKRICWNFWNNTDEDSQWNSNSDAICEEDNDRIGQSQHPIGLTNEGVKIKSYLAVLDTTNYDWTLVENFHAIVDGTLDEDDAVDMIATCESNSGDGVGITSGLTSGDDCDSDAIGYWKDRNDKTGNFTARLYKDSGSSLYTHDATGNEATDFYREIYLQYTLENDGFITTSTVKDNQLLVTVYVWYKSAGGNYTRVTLETELTDYLERTDWLD